MEAVELKQLDVEPVAELSLNSVVAELSQSCPGTMKLRGSINQRSVIVMVDCGAIHNFISQKLVEKLVEELQIVVAETRNYSVIMGLGAIVKGKGVCDSVNSKVGELMIVDSFLPLELGGVDVILGM